METLMVVIFLQMEAMKVIIFLEMEALMVMIFLEMKALIVMIFLERTLETEPVMEPGASLDLSLSWCDIKAGTGPADRIGPGLLVKNPGIKRRLEAESTSESNRLFVGASEPKT